MPDISIREQFSEHVLVLRSLECTDALLLAQWLFVIFSRKTRSPGSQSQFKYLHNSRSHRPTFFYSRRRFLSNSSLEYIQPCPVPTNSPSLLPA
ncbi:MAG: hypothetical protein J7647_02435 [Cyanobacteria bacterium SBLK]|nr:hypothetical protein [Cyanobacteria bacterium SBLK]